MSYIMAAYSRSVPLSAGATMYPKPDSFTLSTNRPRMDDDKNLTNEDDGTNSERPTRRLDQNIPDADEVTESSEEKMKKLIESGPKDVLITPGEP
jgi:hypothetical protein